MTESWPRSWIQTGCSEVCTHDRGQDSPIQTSCSVNKMFIIWRKQEKLNSCNVTAWLVLDDILHTNGDKLKLYLQKFARPLHLFSFFLIRLFSTSIEENSQYFFKILFCNFFTAKCNKFRWENLDRVQYRFQPIKFVNSVGPSPRETQP